MVLIYISPLYLRSDTSRWSKITKLITSGVLVVC